MSLKFRPDFRMFWLLRSLKGKNKQDMEFLHRHGDLLPIPAALFVSKL